MFFSVVPFILIGVVVWFLIAWAGHATLIRLATGAKPLDRMGNKGFIIWLKIFASQKA